MQLVNIKHTMTIIMNIFPNNSKRHIYKSSYYIVLALFLLGSNHLLAAVSDAFVSTEKATPISIDLSNNVTLSTSTNFNSLSTTTPSNGFAQAVNGDPLIRIIVYTPNPDFDNAVDSFDYTVLDINGGAIGTLSRHVILPRLNSPIFLTPAASRRRMTDSEIFALIISMPQRESEPLWQIN